MKSVRYGVLYLHFRHFLFVFVWCEKKNHISLNMDGTLHFTSSKFMMS